MKDIEKDYHGNAIVKPDYIFILKTIVGRTIHIYSAYLCRLSRFALTSILYRSRLQTEG